MRVKEFWFWDPSWGLLGLHLSLSCCLDGRNLEVNLLKKGARGVSGSPGAVWCRPPFSFRPLSSLHLEKNKNKKDGEGCRRPETCPERPRQEQLVHRRWLTPKKKKLKKKQPGHPAPRHVQGAPGRSPQPLPFVSPPCQHPEPSCAHATPRTPLPGALLNHFSPNLPQIPPFSSVTPSRGRSRLGVPTSAGAIPARVSPPSLPVR